MEDKQQKSLSSQAFSTVSHKAPDIWEVKFFLKMSPKKDFTLSVLRVLCKALQTSDFRERREVIIRVDRVQKRRGI